MIGDADYRGGLTYNVNHQSIEIAVLGSVPDADLVAAFAKIKQDLSGSTDQPWAAKVIFTQITEVRESAGELIKEMTKWSFSHGCDSLKLHFIDTEETIKLQLMSKFATFFDLMFSDNSSAFYNCDHTIVKEPIRGFLSINLLD